MSKGLGSLQRRIIEVGGASKTIWQCGVPIPVRVAHDEEKEACGLRVQLMTGSKWRIDGKPWFAARTTVSTREELNTLAANFRDVWIDLFRDNLDAGKISGLAESLLPACISLQHLRCTLWPHLWSKDIKNEPRLDSLNRWMPQVPPDIKRGRNVVEASISRATTSMKKRGLIAYCTMTNRNCRAVETRWKNYNRSGSFEWHSILLVLDERAVWRAEPVC